MKYLLSLLLISLAIGAHAESTCDVRVGDSAGVKVVEFATGNLVHSKMSLKEGSPQAILEEMINLQDMGICTEKILAKRCVLKFEKKARSNNITLFRGRDRWMSWAVRSKKAAQDFVKNLKRVGFCS